MHMIDLVYQSFSVSLSPLHAHSCGVTVFAFYFGGGVRRPPMALFAHFEGRTHVHTSHFGHIKPHVERLRSES